MKRLLVSLLIMSMLLCGCTNASNEIDNGTDNGTGESTPAVTEESPLSDSEPTQTDEIVSAQDESTEVNTETTASESKKSPFPDVNDLRARPDGKEVSIFKDNTFDCDYSGYKEIGYDFGDLHRSVMAPAGWHGFRFYRKDDPSFENMLTGLPIYDGELPVQIDQFDDSTMFKNEPLTKSTFFFAESPWIHAEDFINADGLINKYDYETYIDKKGRSMKVYFIDDLPKYAVYDDFFNLCIWFNLDSEEQIPVVVNMINSIEVSLSREAELTLKTAERLGYTIIPPEE